MFRTALALAITLIVFGFVSGSATQVGFEANYPVAAGVTEVRGYSVTDVDWDLDDGNLVLRVAFLLTPQPQGRYQVFAKTDASDWEPCTWVNPKWWCGWYPQPEAAAVHILHIAAAHP